MGLKVDPDILKVKDVVGTTPSCRLAVSPPEGLPQLAVMYRGGMVGVGTIVG